MRICAGSHSCYGENCHPEKCEIFWKRLKLYTGDN